MTTERQLKDDPRTQEAIESLLARGFPDEQVPVLLRHIEFLPQLVKLYCIETASQKAKRRLDLATKIRQLAREIEQDPEAQHYRIVDHESITTTPFNDRPAVFGFLRDFAAEVERSDGKTADTLDAHSPDRRDRHSTEKQFIVREIVAAFLKLAGGPVKQRPAKPLAQLACVILRDDSVTRQNVRDAFRYVEKKQGVELD